MSERINIYQMYILNDCKFGFYVKRNSWREGRYAKVTEIQWVEEGKMIKGKPPYFGGFNNPPGHPRAGKIMGPREVTLEAPIVQNRIKVMSVSKRRSFFLPMPDTFFVMGTIGGPLPYLIYYFALLNLLLCLT